MDKNEILAILNDWNDWNDRQDIGIIRNSYVDRLEGLISGSNQVITITGPRRAGKSYIMRQMGRRLVEKGVKKENILFINFEDPRFTYLNTQLLGQIYDVYKVFLSPTDTPYIFLDEVQEVEGWEKWVRMMHELKKAKIVISGSNAHLLSRELGTLLTGRHIDFTVFPLSFAEYLMFNNVEIKNNFDIIRKKNEIDRLFYNYIQKGSFPEVALSDRQTEILLNYFSDILTKDILRRFRIRKTESLRMLSKFYFTNTASLISFTSASKFIQAQPHTVERFSGYFEDIYLMFLLKRFSYKIREQEKSPRKVYAIDTGLCNTVGFRFSENIGRLAENIVFITLKQHQMLNPHIELFYWKDVHHREVDFVVKEGLAVKQLIQVCWDMKNDKTRNRELRSLKKAMNELKVSNALIITEDSEGEEKSNGFTLKIIPLKKWLLTNLCFSCKR